MRRVRELFAWSEQRVQLGSAVRASSLFFGLLLSGCFSIEGGPPRLFTVAEEADTARVRLRTWEETYYTVPPNKMVRNEIISSRMREIDSYYYAFEASLIRERQEIGFISSIIGIGLSGAVPLVSSIGTKNALGAASSALQGGSKAFSDEVLFQKTVQVLATQMRAHRADVASDIITRMRTLDLDTYPLSMALGDLDEYYAAGTIGGALIEIQKTVSAEAKTAEAAKADTVLVKFSPTTTLGAKIEAFATATPANSALVSGWLDAKAGGIPRSFFIRTGSPALQKQMIKDLSIP